MKDQMTIMSHLNAFRKTIVWSAISILPGATIGWFIREQILAVLIQPVKASGAHLVYLAATEAFTTELLISVFAGIVLALPFIAYQFWKFVLPALHAHEKRYLVTFVPFSIILFVVGVVFGYFTVFSYGVQFLLGFGMEGIEPTLSLAKYVSFTFWFLLPFGVMFEMPLVLLLLMRMGLVKRDTLKKNRKWVFVGAFVIAAVATPTTDMFSQTVMAAAIYVLYEVSIWISYLTGSLKRPDKAMAETSATDDTVEDNTSSGTIEVNANEEDNTGGNA